MSADGRVTYQVIGYKDIAGVSRVGQTALVRTTRKALARFLSGQLLMWQYAQGNPDGKEVGRRAEGLTRALEASAYYHDLAEAEPDVFRSAAERADNLVTALRKNES